MLLFTHNLIIKKEKKLHEFYLLQLPPIEWKNENDSR